VPQIRRLLALACLLLFVLPRPGGGGWTSLDAMSAPSREARPGLPQRAGHDRLSALTPP